MREMQNGVRVIQLMDGWYAQDFRNGAPIDYGPYRWRWVAALMRWAIMDDEGKAR